VEESFHKHWHLKPNENYSDIFWKHTEKCPKTKNGTFICMKFFIKGFCTKNCNRAQRNRSTTSFKNADLRIFPEGQRNQQNHEFIPTALKNYHNELRRTFTSITKFIIHRSLHSKFYICQKQSKNKNKKHQSTIFILFSR